MLQGLLQSIIRDGALGVRGPDGKVVSVGVAPGEEAPVVVHIHDYATLARIAANPGLAVGEAYMDGRFSIERGSLYDFIAIATRNLSHTRRKRDPRFGLHKNPRRASRRNVAHHYDLSGELYRLFLDADRQYSCAYFAEPGMDLEAAQRAKKRHLAAKLLLKPGQRVLDIGAGWGGLALTLAAEHGAEVLGITLSTEQLDEARARATRLGLDPRVVFDLRDYRDVAGRFDRIVSVGMFEHVGPAHYREYFDTLYRLLNDDGVAVLHTIGRIDGPNNKGNAWIEKYVFPGGTIPSLSQIAPAVETSGLILTDLEVLRVHYADTLRAWRERFAANRDKVRALYDERFCRMWEFYLAGAEAGFREGELVVFQLQLAKDRNAVPRTRDYITDFDRAAHFGARIAAE
jgi:cyclopropane-fatty-acyl-phospholipid synthase